jgi:hypothetical protein
MMAIPNVVASLRPLNLAGWVRWPIPLGSDLERIAGAELWFNESHMVLVCSAVESIAGEDDKARAEYHLSVSRRVRDRSEVYRCDMDTARWAIRQFGFDGAEEDNHVPHGKVRNFFRPFAWNAVGQACICKASEPKIIEDKGDYVWRDASRL